MFTIPKRLTTIASFPDKRVDTRSAIKTIAIVLFMVHIVRCNIRTFDNGNLLSYVTVVEALSSTQIGLQRIFLL